MNCGLLFLLGISFAAPLVAVEVAVAGKPERFLETAQQNWQTLADGAVKPRCIRCSKGRTCYVGLETLIPGQDQISIDNAKFKLQRYLDDDQVQWNKKSEAFEFSFNHGTSAVPLKDAIMVIKGPIGYVILDGHHEVFVSLYVGAKTIPVHVVDDLSHLDLHDFWSYLLESKKVYFKRTLDEILFNPPRFTAMIDRPNRYLATLIAYKVQYARAKGGIKIDRARGVARSVWVKLNKSIPFIEFEIADALDDAGLKYNPKWGTEIPDAVIEKIRLSLIKAAKSGKYPHLAQIPILTLEESKKRNLEDRGFLKNLITDYGNFGIHNCNEKLL